MGKEEKSETLFIDKIRNNCEEVALKCTPLRIAAVEDFKVVPFRASQTASLVQQFIAIGTTDDYDDNSWLNLKILDT